MSNDAVPVNVAVDFIEAWARNDMAAAGGLVDDRISFRGPMAQAEGRKAYLEAVGSFAALVEGIEIIAAVGDSKQAMLLYDMTTAPFGILRAANHFEIRNGRITADKLVFDTHEVRKAQAS